MKYVGSFQNHNLPKNDYPKLFTYSEGREIILNYNDNRPFYIEQISILIDSEYHLYAVFECGLMFTSEVDAKNFGRNFTSELINLIDNYGVM
ncbi:MAG: hypothetical protein MJZ28_12695 [Paludibacteraceae bacterium]|nr:hypothetical protein [Paludibacteraceae bacterium]